MMKTLGPVAPCGSATIDGVNLYYTSAHMHPPFFPPFPVCMHMCKCTHAPCIPMCMYTHMENECTLLLGDHQVSWEQSCPWLCSTDIPPWFVLLVQSCPSLLQQYIHLGMASLGLWVRVLQCIDWLCSIVHSVASSSLCYLYTCIYVDSTKVIANLLSAHMHKLSVTAIF